MKGQNVGYIRVSTTTQNTARQLEGVELDKVFEEKVSGKNANREELKKCLGHLREGDTLHVHSIDRLARSLVDLRGIIEQLHKEGVTVVFHKEQMTFKPKSKQDGDKMAIAMQNLMLSMLGAFAEFEREIILERRADGIAIAKANNVKFGRTAKVTPEIALEIQSKKANGAKVTDLMIEYGIGKQTVYDALKK